MKLCIVYNFAAHYRAGIFQLIDKEYDCDWFFGKRNDDITPMDLSLLNGKVCEVDRWYWHGIEFQKGIIGLLQKPYNTYLIFAQTKTLSTWLFLFLSKFYPHKKVFLWSHGFYGKESKLERNIKKWMFKLPNGGTFLYNNYARELMIEEGIHPDRLFVLHNSLDYNHQIEIRRKVKDSTIYHSHFANENPTIIFIGRLTKVKRLDLLVKAVVSMNKSGCPVNLVMVGDGVERESLEHQVEDYSAQPYVWFFGASYDEFQNAELIYNADVCVAPGNVGLTAMHTMVYGTPVITHDDFPHQMPEFEAIKEGKTGAFFKRDDIESMQNTIKDWISSMQGKRDTVRMNCFQEIDNYWNPEFQIVVIKKVIHD